jgi:predicted DCC family thiol-disulfide oxidoreductase YuxK
MEEKNSNPIEHKDIVLFDGVCNLCNFAVNFIIDRDPHARFVFASLQSTEGQRLLKSVGLHQGQMDSLVLVRNKKAYLRSTAALEIVRNLTGPWPVFYIFKVVPYPIRDFIYNLVAQNRYRLFGKRNTCRYPTTPLRARFLHN